MKKLTISVTLRAGIATALCLSFLLYPPLRPSSATAASAHAATDLKTESQLRSEASRYDGAIRAVAGIATMKLETPEDLKKAFAVLERERPNLKFHFSKLVVLAISDSTYSGAIKKKIPDKQAAEAFAKELEADLKAVLKLDGARSLKTRMERSAEADAAVLRRAGERLKLAGEKIKKAAQQAVAPDSGASSELRVIRAGFGAATQPFTAPSPVVFVQLIILALAYAVIVLNPIQVTTFLAIGFLASLFTNLFTEEGQDQVAACQEEADDRYRSCESDANALPSGFPLFIREAALALCYGTWLIETGDCLLFA